MISFSPLLCFVLIFQESGTQRERYALNTHKNSDEAASTELTSILSNNTQQPALSMMDEYDSYFDYLAGERPMPLRYCCVNSLSNCLVRNHSKNDCHWPNSFLVLVVVHSIEI